MVDIRIKQGIHVEHEAAERVLWTGKRWVSACREEQACGGQVV